MGFFAISDFKLSCFYVLSANLFPSFPSSSQIDAPLIKKGALPYVTVLSATDLPHFMMFSFTFKIPG